jgi:hypothetical protein
VAGNESERANEGLGALLRWVGSLTWSLQRAVGPVAFVVLWAALAFQLYVSYVTESLLFYPLAVVVMAWSYAVYAFVVFAIAPFLQVLVILPVSLMWGACFKRCFGLW